MQLTRRVPFIRSFKFAPFAIISLFLFSNLTGIFFGHVFAPTAQASSDVSDARQEDYIPSDIPTSGDHDLDLIILHAGERYGVDPRFIHAVIWRESKYNPAAKSHAGAEGLMQLMPATARRFHCDNVADEAANVEAGTRYLRWLLKRFNGDVELALAGYNAGEGAVEKFSGVPPFNETQNYVRIITARYGKTFHPVLTPEEALNEFHLLPEVAQLRQ